MKGTPSPGLNDMETMYNTLLAIYNIVKQDTDPTTFPCTYRDIILSSISDTVTIQQDLDALINENLLLVKKLDCVVFCITKAGIELIHTFKEYQLLGPVSGEQSEDNSWEN